MSIFEYPGNIDTINYDKNIFDKIVGDSIILSVGQRSCGSHVQRTKRVDNKMVVKLEYPKEQGSILPVPRFLP